MVDHIAIYGNQPISELEKLSFKRLQRIDKIVAEKYKREQENRARVF